MEVKYQQSGSKNPYDDYVVRCRTTKPKRLPKTMHELSDEELDALIERSKEVECNQEPSIFKKGVGSWRNITLEEQDGYVDIGKMIDIRFSELLTAMRDSKKEGSFVYGRIGKAR